MSFNLLIVIPLLICILFVYLAVLGKHEYTKRNGVILFIVLFLVFIILLFTFKIFVIYYLAVTCLSIVGFLILYALHRHYIYTLAGMALILTVLFNFFENASWAEFCMVLFYLIISVGVVKDLVYEE